MYQYRKYLFVVYLISVIILLVIPTADTGIKLNLYLFGIRTDHFIHALIFLPFAPGAVMNFGRSNLPVIFFMGIFFASLCEGLHYFIPYRQFGLDDYFANTVGITLGVILSFLVLKKY